VWRLTDLKKIIAPRLRAKEEKADPLEDFIVKEETPMEDFDPELTVNPVILAKMAYERERAGRKRRKGKHGAGGPVWRGGPGALARLGLKIVAKAPKEEGPKTLRGLKEIDVMIHRHDQAVARAVAEKGSERRSALGEASSRGQQHERATSSRSQSSRREREGEGRVDIARTLTMHSQRKKEKTRALAADRMVAQAKHAQCAANKRQCARAAAKLACSNISEGGSEAGADHPNPSKEQPE